MMFYAHARRPGWPLQRVAEPAPAVVPGARDAALWLASVQGAPQALADQLARLSSPGTAVRLLDAALTEARAMAGTGGTGQ